MHFLFPSDPFDKSVPDEAYSEEFAALRDAGATYSLFSFEEFESGEFKAKPLLPPGEKVLYRGWMLTPEAYEKLYKAVTAKGGVPEVDPAEYRRCHYLPEWYPLCKDITPETVFAKREDNFVEVIVGKQWPAYFVKDFVKSLTTERGSIAAAPGEIAEVVSLIEKFRGKVEGGVCIRKFEQLLPETEERYFVFNKKAYARSGEAPALVQELAKRIDSPFFSVDLVTSKEGELRLIELGDGQVSDRKKWSASQFASMLLA